jgi:hypothetical protein
MSLSSSSQQPVLQLKQSEVTGGTQSPPPLRDTLAAVAAKTGPPPPSSQMTNAASLANKFSTFNINNQFKGKAVELQQKTAGTYFALVFNRLKSSRS